MKKCDLHIHSNFSDSDASLEDIFKQAKSKGLSCVAITDHDTVEGMSLARTCGKRYGIELIEGIELSAEHKDAEIHVLGYFVNSQDEKLKEELAQIKELRRERILWMVARLNSLGIGIDKNELLCEIGEAVPTRLHLGLYLVKKRKANSLSEAFKKYLSPGRPAYQVYFKHSVKEAIDLIKEAGGLAFLAHPHVIIDQSIISEFISFGLDGLELVYPGMSAAKSLLYRDMAAKAGLLQSGGSDAHGSYKKFIEIGQVDVPYQWVEDMKALLHNSTSV